MLVLDGSGSIQPEEGVRVREGARQIVNAYTLGDTTVRLGVVRFATDVALLQGLSRDGTALNAALDTYTTGGRTNMGGGLLAGAAELSANGRVGVPKVIILITDGIPTVGLDPEPIAADIRAAGTTIVVAGIGEDINPPLLDALASSGSAFIVGTFDAFLALTDALVIVGCPGGVLTGLPSDDNVPSLVLPCLYPVPGGSVVGDVPAGAQIYWRPGDVSPGLALNPGTYWVIGQDASETYYKVSIACQAPYVWIRKDTAGPSFQPPQNGTPLPTRIVQ